ncbi:MAG TPA: DUF3800 domain-containing protein [Dehalococcoidales bacterium]
MLVFIDESGHPHPGSDIRRPVLLALCMRESDSRSITSEIYRLKTNLLGGGKENLEIKARELLDKATFRRIPEKKELIEGVFDVIRRFDLNIFATVMEKPDRVPYYRPPDMLPHQHRFLVIRVNYCAEEKGPGEMALLIFDSQDTQNDQSLGKAMARYLYGSQEGQSLQRLIETPLFIDSTLATGMQLADLCAYCVREYYEEGLDATWPKDAYHMAIKRYFDIISAKSKNYPSPHGILYGICKMPKRWFEQPEEQATTPKNQEGSPGITRTPDPPSDK